MSWQIYLKLGKCLFRKEPIQIKRELQSFFSSSQFNKWKGKHVFLSKYYETFSKKSFQYSVKGIIYIIPKIYNAFRAAIREIRKELEESKSHFNKVKFLVLMNLINMKSHHRTKLRKYLKEFPWLRSYRHLLVKYYYQLITDTSHPWLRSAVQTLIDNEENVFRFQHVLELFPKVKPSKSYKVVNESCNKLMNQLYQTQCGMRTIENIRMRISNRLKCPIIISPNLLEKI